MSEAYLGEIRIFGGNFAPRDWMFCNGQILSIAQNTALFSLLGTTYGGNGTTTFALPDLRGRAPVHQGQGPGLSSYTMGEVSGSEDVTLTTQQMPQHSHGLMHGGIGTQASPQNGLLGTTSARDFRYTSAAATTNLAADTLTTSGGSQPHENRSPYLAVGYIICVGGIFPSRN
ncbi:microcystin-dependent protein [Acidovorax soli]|uniref:Microcystin-dependent protein n=1 Tax=Acidovorax soli TaxID=592050 RepID=A0A7X0P8T5_9BURK|nr:tail fiber protein [Acidovorax soli]MBB6557438.1 microcystin-dependent protein [Acidovorax soli]